jgi:hypothetical protein
VPRIDHIAFRIDDAAEWAALADRMNRHAIPYQLAETPLTDELQLFVRLAPGVAVEFVTRLNHASSTFAHPTRRFSS